MFYSHEILSSTQYGVATIWLAATMARGAGPSKGTGALKRLSRKAVQEVDVPKACETIINPGAPLALRLQGSLLYGVSRVFSEQCRYVLSDAEKTQSDMMTFFRALQTNETDPQAGKTKRHLIVLQDDPSFDLFSALPSLDSLLGSQNLVGVPSQGSSRNFSLMTPAGGLSQVSVSSGREDAAFLSLGLLPSSSSRPDSYRLPSDLRGRSSPLGKHGQDAGDGVEFPAFDHDALDPIGIDLDFDGQGNLIGFVEDELPPLPAAAPRHQAPPSRDDDRFEFGEPEDRPLPDEGDGQVLTVDEAAVPDVDALAVRPSIEKDSDSWVKASSSTVTEQATAANRRGRPRKVLTMLDNANHVSRGEFRAWTRDYVENMDASRKRLKTAMTTTTTTTPGQARKNAYALLYGNGIARIGVPRDTLGRAHPLASEFAGQALEAHLAPGPEFKDGRGRRRKSDEAFSQDGDEEERNVRQKVDGDAEMGRGGDDNGPPPLDDPPTPEMGMHAARPLDEGRSSSMMPWSRPGSAAQSARKAVVTPSPLHGRGSAMASIERRSDAGATDTPFGREEHSSFEEPWQAAASWPAAAGLDQASQAFLEYGSGRAVVGDGDGRRWVDFEELAGPATQTRAVAAQAFLHVLSLATKGVVAVQQDGADRDEPFGAIRVGFPPLAAEGGHDG
ncbi:hypothetical protein L249_4656 [Ophiocordyceps polyrhachis-furcata BCC 54312]|uniref:Rad21/Rec8-like protein N-terminal domain-containing protein n=1 Tax=Ophiocordyceps polyrhachis-furcata BCC 54312 TaxID=1330021 RepID=A0A367L2Z3_9HYPO|nr:hypothetical protein L249_4656 [Ophiocordyceps polyrhachis-furcata BCC 54312]